MLAGLLTNGYLLNVERIRRLNRAGLDNLQISIDNVTPDDVSKKSLKVLDQKLWWLSRYAEFDVNQYSVADLEREYHTIKSCAPYCTVSCVHRVTVVDEFRENPRRALSQFFPGKLPVPVRILRWLFLPTTPGQQTVMARLTLRLFHLK
jgi:hypothetical protein